WIDTSQISGPLSALSTISWRTEPGLLILLSIHPVCLMLILLLRRRSWLLFGLLLLLLASVLAADAVNRQLATHWRVLRFGEQYFDSPGFFITFIWSVPVLVNCVVILCFLIYQMMNLTVDKERARLLTEAKDRRTKKD
ncbi:hypothetical protein BOX15_Mlig018444g1, partial [Macrostomum lignano]